MEQGDNQHKRMFEQAVRELAAIDTLLGIGDDGCGDHDMTISAIKELKIRAGQEANAPVDNLSGFSLHLTREEWGHVYDGLILERERSIQRKSANPESNSDEISKACEEVMARIRCMTEIN